jgi:hypothetical protein
VSIRKASEEGTRKEASEDIRRSIGLESPVSIREVLADVPNTVREIAANITLTSLARIDRSSAPVLRLVRNTVRNTVLVSRVVRNTVRNTVLVSRVVRNTVLNSGLRTAEVAL